MTSVRMVETSVTNKTPSQDLNQLSEQISAIRFFIKKWSSRRILSSNKRIIMDAQSSLRKRADCIQRILCGSRRILRSPMPNENPGIENLFLFIGKTERNINLTRQNLVFFFLQSQRSINSYVCWPLKSCHMMAGIDFDEGGILNTREKPSVHVGMRRVHIQKSKSAWFPRSTALGRHPSSYQLYPRGLTLLDWKRSSG